MKFPFEWYMDSTSIEQTRKLLEHFCVLATVEDILNETPLINVYEGSLGNFTHLDRITHRESAHGVGKFRLIVPEYRNYRIDPKTSELFYIGKTEMFGCDGTDFLVRREDMYVPKDLVLPKNLL